MTHPLELISANALMETYILMIHLVIQFHLNRKWKCVESFYVCFFVIIFDSWYDKLLKLNRNTTVLLENQNKNRTQICLLIIKLWESNNNRFIPKLFLSLFSHPFIHKHVQRCLFKYCISHYHFSLSSKLFYYSIYFVFQPLFKSMLSIHFVFFLCIAMLRQKCIKNY